MNAITIHSIALFTGRFYNIACSSINSEIAYQYCLFTVNSNCVSIINSCDGFYKIFDPHSRDNYGIPDPNGKCVLVSVDGIKHLGTCFQNTITIQSVTPFEIKGVNVGLLAYQSVKKQAFQVRKLLQIKLFLKEHKQQRVQMISNQQCLLGNSRIYKIGELAEKGVRDLHNQTGYLKKLDIRNSCIHRQVWTKLSVQSFSKSIHYAIASYTVCKEALPVKTSVKMSETYI